MIVLNYRTINSESFNQGVKLLAAHSGFTSFQATYNMAKFARKFEQELKLARELFMKWVEKYLEKDAEGKLKVADKPHPQCPWEIKEGLLAEFEKEMASFLDTKVEIPVHPLKASDIGKINLSPAQVLALEPIFDPADFSPQAPLES